MSLENLQSTLQRIADIESRIGTLLPTAQPATPQGAPTFDEALGQALSETMGNQAAAPVPAALSGLIEVQAQANGLDGDLLKAIIKTESNFNPNAVSPVGAQGLMQLMPGTAAELGVSNSFDPVQNLAGGAKYLKTLLNKYHSVPQAVAAYNAGPGAVDKYNGIPPYKETTQYVQKVMQSYQAYQNAQGG
ncbi:lytic transglycosylase domain-containing protein [Vampirovibrio chlorellavorus]|uniref:lytic transglycosylase domain-containing protein n=1 Tax=Vampirovibrio chlorellavorus TaxID=758823 RepID=UPI0026F3509A|nr:lytic transglycosylase domain-containing protein [Vampirovibrio chlorellavorus]